jgi:hypothetical protein
MSTFGPGARNAARLLGRAPAEARHLHAVEQEGESGETPFLALLGVSLVLVLPVFLVMPGLAVAAYYLA